MEKVELSRKVRDVTGMTYDQAKIAVDAVFSVMAEEMRLGRQVRIRDFFTFSSVEHGARQVRNPQTGALMFVDGYRKPVAKAGAVLKRMMREGDSE